MTTTKAGIPICKTNIRLKMMRYREEEIRLNCAYLG